MFEFMTVMHEICIFLQASLCVGVCTFTPALHAEHTALLVVLSSSLSSSACRSISTTAAAGNHGNGWCSMWSNAASCSKSSDHFMLCWASLCSSLFYCAAYCAGREIDECKENMG